MRRGGVVADLLSFTCSVGRVVMAMSRGRAVSRPFRLASRVCSSAGGEDSPPVSCVRLTDQMEIVPSDVPIARSVAVLFEGCACDLRTPIAWTVPLCLSAEETWDFGYPPAKDAARRHRRGFHSSSSRRASGSLTSSPTQTAACPLPAPATKATVWENDVAMNLRVVIGLEKGVGRSCDRPRYEESDSYRKAKA